MLSWLRVQPFLIHGLSIWLKVLGVVELVRKGLLGRIDLKTTQGQVVLLCWLRRRAVRPSGAVRCW
jgi:hypothetical protein